MFKPSKPSKFVQWYDHSALPMNKIIASHQRRCDALLKNFSSTILAI